MTAVLIAVAHHAAAQSLVRAAVTPAANAQGWNNTSVTIAFECAPTVVCPKAVTLSEDGAGQRVTRTVVDESGRSANATVLVNIDQTPPRVAIMSPATSRSVEAQSQTVTASLSDAGSGIQSAACNGRPGRIEQGIVRCAMTLGDGVNDIIVSASDLAGNSASAAVSLTREGPPQSLAIIPSVTTLTVGQGQALQLVDNVGRTVEGASWTSDNTSVARLTTNPSTAVVGTGSGEATVMASSGRLSARIRVRVQEGPLPIGTTRWAIDPPLPGLKGAHFPRLQMFPGGPDMLTVYVTSSGAPVLISALTETPRQLWIEQPAIAASERVEQWMGDHSGGALLLLTRATADPVAIVRVGRPADGSLWRYESAGRLAHDWAMDWDGTIYISETRSDGASEIVGIDSNTGLATFRVPIPPHRWSRPGCQAGTGDLKHEMLILGPPTVPDGVEAAFQFVVANDVKDCLTDSSEIRWSKRDVYLLRVRADGTSVETLLTDFQTRYPDRAPAVTLFRVLPDGDGGLLALMRADVPGQPPMNRVVRLSNAGVDEYSLPAVGECVIGHQWAFTTDGQVLVAFDPKTGRIGWSRQATSGQYHIRFAEARGGVVVSTDAGTELFAAEGGSSTLLMPVSGDEFLPSRRR